MTLICCQLVKKGRYVVAEPWFEPGQTMALHDAKERAEDAGKLAIVSGDRAYGRVVEVLGGVDDIHAAMRGLLAEAGRLGETPQPGEPVGAPSPAVHAQLDALPEEIPFIDTREDRRADLVVTIDPPTAKDHDDAIGLERAPEGASHAWTLAVHIADVSAYVPPGSPIDEDARERSMSAYVPGTVAPMLPFELSSDLCSLRPGVDRGCVSVFADLAQDGEVLDVRFARTLIRSARRLTYDQVDEVLRGHVQVDPTIDALLARMDQATASLRARRMARGALDMALPEVEVTLGETAPESAKLSTESPSHRLVEECMLVANEQVGAALVKADAPGIWRVHEHPEPESIEALMVTFGALNIPTPPVPENLGGRGAAKVAAAAAKLAQRYAETSRRGRRSFAPRVLRSLQKASYQAHTGPHSGLATEDYAHFTSPIRRYPDLVVHRSLLRLIGAGEDEPAVASLDEIAQHVSTTEGELQKLERRADKVVLAHLLYRRMHGSEPMGDDGDGKWSGEIVGLVGGGVFVAFGEVYDGFIPARTFSPDERYELDELGLAMVGAKSGHSYRLGDPVEVYVDGVNRANGRVELRLVGTPSDAHRDGRPGGGRPGGPPRGNGPNGRPKPKPASPGGSKTAKARAKAKAKAKAKPKGKGGGARKGGRR